MKKESPSKKFVGAVGEELAARFLERRGFEIIDRNYWKPWGEIDVVARKSGVVHFVEVKTVQQRQEEAGSREQNSKITKLNIKNSPDEYRPEQNVHPWKLQRLHRVIETYLMDERLDDMEWQLDVVTVRLDLDTRKAKMDWIENVI